MNEPTYFSEIKKGNIVGETIVASQDVVDALPGRYVETFMDANGDATKRYNYASAGYIYDEDADAFIPPQPYPSWVLNLKTYNWESPVVRPASDGDQQWDEAKLSWVPTEN